MESCDNLLFSFSATYFTTEVCIKHMLRQSGIYAKQGKFSIECDSKRRRYSAKSVCLNIHQFLTYNVH